MLNRRHFLQTTAVAAAAHAQTAKKIAIVGATTDPAAKNLAERFEVGYPYAGVWRKPNFQVTRGASADAVKGVDGVAVFGDDALFEQCLKAIEAGGRAVPVYRYKDLGTSFEKAKQAVEVSRRLKFPLMAAAPGPFTWRLPSIELPANVELDSAVVVTPWGEGEAFENLEAMVERRKGGETGVKAVESLSGDAVWKAMEDGRISKELLTSALSRSDTPMGLSDKDGRPQNLVKSGELQKLAKTPTAYLIEYRDGLKGAVLRVEGAIRDFNLAVKGKAAGQMWSTQFLMTPAPMFTHSACLAHHIVQMIESGSAAVPVERALLVAGLVDAGAMAKGRRVETAHLGIAYKAPKDSQHART